jgi:hypothetical protein
VPLFNHMTGATICDFCSGANPVWRYPAATFHDSFGSKSVEDWLACEACHAMIEAGDREGLIERAFRCPGIPQVVAMRGREWGAELRRGSSQSLSHEPARPAAPDGVLRTARWPAAMPHSPPWGAMG